MMQFYICLVVPEKQQLSNLLILFFIAISHFGFSQNNDEFRQQTTTVSDPLLKVELILAYTDSLLWLEEYMDDIPVLLDEVIEICQTSDCGEALLFAKASLIDFNLNRGNTDGALTMAKALLVDPITKSPELKAYIHQLIGMYFLVENHSANEYNHFLKGVHVLESDAPLDRRLGILYYYTAVLYDYKSFPDSCLYFGKKALSNFEDHKDTINLVLVHLAFNGWYHIVGDSEKSFKSMLEAQKLSKEFELKDAGYFDVAIGMVYTYRDRKEYSKAITITEEAIARILQGTTMNNQDRAEKLWNLYLLKGRSLLEVQELEEGLLFIRKSIAVSKENNLFSAMALTGTLIEIEALLKLKEYEKSRSILSDFIINIEKDPSYELFNIKIISLLTELYKSTGTKPKESEVPILRKLIKRVIAKNEGKYNKNLLRAYELAALLQLNENRKIEAIASYDKISEIKDSIWSHEKTAAVNKLLIDYESKEQQQEIALQQERLDEADVYQKLLISLLTVLSLLVALAALFFWQRKQYVNNLEYKVRERTAALEATNKKLVDSNEELERFAYITSHDLKEPLRNIISFIGLLDKKGLGADTTTKSYFRFIKENSVHMSQLIEGVLAFSLLKKTEVIKKNVNVLQVIAKVQGAISQTISEKNIQFKISNLPIVKTDDSMLYMVFKNLIENAIKYNENKMPIIEVSYTEDEQFYWFSVSDNGIGIEEEYFNQIFEMFKRLHNKSQYVGTGIGLAICKRTVKYLGGEIAVTSKLNEGSVFNFSIPK